MSRIVRRGSGLRLCGLVCLLLCAVWLSPGSACALLEPDSRLYVTDTAGVLSEGTRAAILEQAQALHTASGAQLAVLTVPNLEGMDIKTYAHETATRWKLGDATKNNGLLLLLSVGDRKIRVEVGYGLEGALPDAKVGRLIDRNAIPAFRNNDFDAGTLALFNALAAEVRIEYGLPVPEGTPGVAPAEDDEGSAWAALLLLVGMAVVVFLLIAFVGLLAEIIALVWRKTVSKKKAATQDKGFFLMRWFRKGLYIVTLTTMGGRPSGTRSPDSSRGGWSSGSSGSSGGGGSFGGGGSDRGF